MPLDAWSSEQRPRLSFRDSRKYEGGVFALAPALPRALRNPYKKRWRPAQGSGLTSGVPQVSQGGLANHQGRGDGPFSFPGGQARKSDFPIQGRKKYRESPSALQAPACDQSKNRKQSVERVKISGQGRGNSMRQDVQESPLEESRALTSAMINETDPYDRPCGALGR